MDNCKARFSFEIDARNPCHFFAACGVLELSTLLWEDAQGVFQDKYFYIHTKYQEASIESIIEILKQARVKTLNKLQTISFPQGSSFKNQPVIIQFGEYGNIYLDWWLSFPLRAEKSNKTINFEKNKTYAFLSGQQNYEDTIENILKEIRDKYKNPVEKFILPLKTHFRFDSELFCSSTTVGFSPNAEKMNYGVFPFHEIMCAIGLQRFRSISLQIFENKNIFYYACWKIPLDILTAQSIVSQLPEISTKNAYLQNQFVGYQVTVGSSNRNYLNIVNVENLN